MSSTSLPIPSEAARPRALGAALLLTVLAGCASGPGGGAKTPQASADPAPSTAWDPPPWSPPPEDDAATGRVVGVRASGGYDQPRWVLMRFIRAIRDGDEAILRELLADPVHSPRLRQRPRDWWIDRLTRSRRRHRIGSDVQVDRLVSLRQAEVKAIEAITDPPPGLRGSDLIITFPLEPQGRRLLSPLLFWRRNGQLLIRPGPEPRILGL